MFLKHTRDWTLYLKENGHILAVFTQLRHQGIIDVPPLKTCCSLVEFDLFAPTLELFLLIKLHHHPLKWACDYPHFITVS